MKSKKTNVVIKLIIVLSFLIFIGMNFFIHYYIPNQIKIFVNRENNFGYQVPLKADLSGDLRGVLEINHEPVPKDQISIDLNQPFSIQSTETGKFNVDLKFLGIFPIKALEVEVINPDYYIPSGRTVGVTVNTDGILVLGTGNIIDYSGKKVSPGNGKLYSGDYIKKVNQQNVESKEELIQIVNQSNGEEIDIEFERNGNVMTTRLTPVKTSVEGEYKLGLWVRDDTQGIGTITYINSDNHSFGALGHGITDIDTKQLMKISNGKIVDALITNVTKGQNGLPGEISGIIVEENDKLIGDITVNSEYGIFGTINQNAFYKYFAEDTMPLGFKYDIHEGKAYILSDVSGEMKKYEISIEKIYLNDQTNKGMFIKVVDKNLLNETNGIVQGMSGSPIIQDNMLIGAVTHVFVQDSTKGYGTFIENMILGDKKE